MNHGKVTYSRSEKADSFRAIFWLLVLATLTLYSYASLSLLAYYADSANYLLHVLIHKSFFLVEPASRTVQIMEQLPVVLALKLGATNIYRLSVMFGLNLLLIPLLELILCYLILPGDRKLFIVFPLLHFLIGTQASFFPVVTEAPITAGYFWVLFYLILFRARTPRNILLISIVSLPAIYLHESMVFLAPVLALSVALFLLKEKKFSYRVVYLLLIDWFIFIAGIDLDFVINPRSTVNRHDFMSQLLHLDWIYWQGINTTTIFGFIFLVFAAVLGICLKLETARKRFTTLRKSLPVIFAFICVTIFILALIVPHFYGVITQFAARCNCTLLSLPLSLIALWSCYRPSAMKIWKKRQARLLVAVLGLAILSTHAIGIYRWSEYIHFFKDVVNTHQGFLSQAEILDNMPNKTEKIIYKEMSSSWTYPTLSYLLAKNGRVKSIVLNNKTPWQPFDPCNAKSLPRNELFDISPILKYLKDNGCRSEPIIRKQTAGKDAWGNRYTTLS